MLERASIVGQLVKNLPAMQETQVRVLGWEDPWRRKWQPDPVFWPGEFHGQRSVAGYSPWGHRESDTTEQLTYFVSQIREGWYVQNWEIASSTWVPRERA